MALSPGKPPVHPKPANLPDFSPLTVKHSSPHPRFVRPSPAKLVGMKVSNMLAAGSPKTAMQFLQIPTQTGNEVNSVEVQKNGVEMQNEETETPGGEVETPVKVVEKVREEIVTRNGAASPSTAYLTSSFAGYGPTASARKKILDDDVETGTSVMPLLTDLHLNMPLQRSIIELEQKNKTLLQNLQFLLKDREKELENFRERFYDLQSELRTRERALAEKDKEISDKERKCLENMQMEQSLKDTVSNLQVSMNLHEFQVNLLKTQVQEHVTKVKSLESQLQVKDTLLQVEIDKKKENKQELEAKLFELREREQQMQAVQNQMHQMQLELKVQNERIESLQDEKKRFRSQLASQVLEVVQHSFCNPVKSLVHDKNNLQTEFSNYKKEVDHMMHSIQPAVNKLVASNNMLIAQYNKEREIRKKIQNDLIELKGNIRVFCRVRPPTRTSENCMEVNLDNSDGEKLIVKSDASAKSVDPSIPTYSSFQFDRVFGPDSSQAFVFADVQPFIQSCIDGYNVCIFAYGQTGSGKTFTMEGPAENPGVNYRALTELFNHVDSRRAMFTYQVNVSVVEIYNEEPKDLLTKRTGQKLDIRIGDSGVFIPDLTSIQVESADHVMQILRNQAYPNRSVSMTSMNDCSSRSHCILFVTVQGQHKTTDEVIFSKLVMVDLAGSERVGRTDAQGDRLKEAQFINKSLSALGDVIASLKTHQSHTPFRNSKLTFLLQDCLSGSSKSLMFCNVSPEDADRNESICSLKFAERVRAVTLGPTQKSNTSTVELTKLKASFTKLKDETKVLNSKYEDVSSQLASTKESFAQLQKDSKSKFIEAASLQSKLNDRDREFREINVQLSNSKAEIERLLKQNSSLNDRLNDASSYNSRTPRKALAVDTGDRADTFSRPISAASSPKARIISAGSPVARSYASAASPKIPFREIRNNVTKPAVSTPLFKRSVPNTSSLEVAEVKVTKKRKSVDMDSVTPSKSHVEQIVTKYETRSRAATPSKCGTPGRNIKMQIENLNENDENDDCNKVTGPVESKKRVRFNQQVTVSTLPNGNNTPRKATGIIKSAASSPKAVPSMISLKPKETFKPKPVSASANTGLGRAPSKVATKASGWKKWL